MARIYNLRVFENLVKQTAVVPFQPGAPATALPALDNFIDIFADGSQPGVPKLTMRDFLATEKVAGNRLFFVRTHGVSGLRQRILVMTVAPNIGPPALSPTIYPPPPLITEGTPGASPQIVVFEEIGAGVGLANPPPGYVPVNSEWVFQGNGFDQSVPNQANFLNNYLDVFDTAQSRRILDVQVAQVDTRTQIVIVLRDT